MTQLTKVMETNITRLSKVMIAAGQSQMTEDYIRSQLTDMIDTADAANLSIALSLFKSRPEVKRALSLGDLVEAEYDVLAVSEKDNPRDTTVSIQEAILIRNNSGKPEMRTSSRWYKKDGSSNFGAAPIKANKSYTSKANIGKGISITLPDNEDEYTEHEKQPLFTTEHLQQLVALPVEEFQKGSTGMVYGVVGKKADTYIEISTDGSLLPLRIWTSGSFGAEPLDSSDIIEGDTVISAGYYGKNFNARYLKRVQPTDLQSKLGKI